MRKTKALFIVISVIVVTLAGLSFYFYHKLSVLKENPQKIAQDEARVLAGEVGKLAVLPEGELPTIATVSDPDALKDQAFFAGAKKGDKVLIYRNANKAILYDPTLQKIINMAPLNIAEAQKTSTAPQSTEKSSVAKKK